MRAIEINFNFAKSGIFNKKLQLHHHKLTKGMKNYRYGMREASVSAFVLFCVCVCLLLLAASLETVAR